MRSQPLLGSHVLTPASDSHGYDVVVVVVVVVVALVNTGETFLGLCLILIVRLACGKIWGFESDYS